MLKTLPPEVLRGLNSDNMYLNLIIIHLYYNLEELREIFDSLDSDKSGTINMEEIEGVIKKLGLKFNESQVKVFMNNIDKNKNGKIGE